jgi:hypothetical protein
MGGRGRAKPVVNGHADAARQVVISEWDRWASKHLSTGYKASRDDEMRFFSHMQEVCPRLLPAGRGGPWQTVHGWLLLERRVASGPGRRPKSPAGLARERSLVNGGEFRPIAGAPGQRRSRVNRTRGSRVTRPTDDRRAPAGEHKDGQGCSECDPHWD